ncbi:tyrosyl-DNA phosphodiesterase-domain-containing protein [Coemansia spiralis]|nr:tyrosyl-DNA phosphodiesterase-domain-containing protein [Coemansia spiralis]
MPDTQSSNCKGNESGTDSSIEQQLHEFDDLVEQGVIVIPDSPDNSTKVLDLIDTEQIEELPTKPTDGALDIVRETADRRKRKHSCSPEPLEFPNGTIKLTHILNERRDTTRSFTFSDVVQKATLRKALLTTFVLDMDWLLPHFGESTKLVIVKSPNGEQPGVYQSSRVTIVSPIFGTLNYPVMHSKVMLFFHDTYVRLAVSSANLIPVDWTVLANNLYVHDFPYNPNGKFHEVEFGKMLAQSLCDMDVPKQVVDELKSVDFSTARVHIVTSVPTPRLKIKRPCAQAYGIERLAVVMKRLRENVAKPDWYNTSLFCYGSSLGALNPQYLYMFYRCALGSTANGMDNASECLNMTEAEYKKAVQKRIAVGFHTQEQALSNKFGEIPRASIKFASDAYCSKTYPKYALHKIKPKVPDVLIHSKAILARYGKESKGWMYLGSHNFTRGAWGSVRGDNTVCSYVNNYEFGVVIPNISYNEPMNTVSWDNGEIPLPFEIPPWVKYEESDLPCLN